MKRRVRGGSLKTAKRAYQHHVCGAQDEDAAAGKNSNSHCKYPSQCGNAQNSAAIAYEWNPDTTLFKCDTFFIADEPVADETTRILLGI